MRKVLLAVVLGGVLVSCNEYQKVLKEEAIKPKYEMAEKFYQEKDFKRANRLYEQIHKSYIGKPQGERLFFFFADTYYQMEDYINAAYQFDRFAKAYPRSEKVEEAMFLGAKSKFKESPKYSIDQSMTDEGIKKIQNFINTFPDSKYLAEANAMAKELTTKKERKAFEIAKHYLKLGGFNLVNYRAAVASFNNFIKDNPGSVFREDALFYRVESSFKLALVSIPSKEVERLEAAKDYYTTFVKYFPESKHKKDADKMLTQINKKLEKLSK